MYDGALQAIIASRPEPARAKARILVYGRRETKQISNI